MKNEKNETEKDAPLLCGGKALPKDPPNPGEIGYWSCVNEAPVWNPS